MDILEILINFAQSFSEYSYLAVFMVLLLCGFGLPIPEDITLVAGGVLAGLGYANEHMMFAVGMAGVLIGDGIMFTAGRVFGRRVLNFRLIAKILTPKRFKAVQEKFDKYGNWVLFVARFLPGLRSPIFVTAGMTGRVSYAKFLLMDGLAALISVPVWVYLGYYGASNIDHLMHLVHQGQAGILSVIAILALVLGFMWWKRRKKQQDETV